MNSNSSEVPLGWIKNRYGSKQGLLNYLFYQLFYYLGFYKQAYSLPLKNVARLVFVCQGNICRSALAEAAINKAFPVTSFGLNTQGNAPADPRTLVIAHQLGLNIDQHRTRKLEDYTPIAGDLLVTMEPAHQRTLKNYFNKHTPPITFLGLWGKCKKIYIHDPFNTNPVYFEHCEQQVVNCALALLQAIQNAHNP